MNRKFQSLDVECRAARKVEQKFITVQKKKNKFYFVRINSPNERTIKVDRVNCCMASAASSWDLIKKTKKFPKVEISGKNSEQQKLNSQINSNGWRGTWAGGNPLRRGKLNSWEFLSTFINLESFPHAPVDDEAKNFYGLERLLFPPEIKINTKISRICGPVLRVCRAFLREFLWRVESLQGLIAFRKHLMKFLRFPGKPIGLRFISCRIPTFFTQIIHHHHQQGGVMCCDNLLWRITNGWLSVVLRQTSGSLPG